QCRGVTNTFAYIKAAPGLGAVGGPLSGCGCVTGQSNGRGGREHGQKSDQLPGYRRIDDERARAHIADIWGLPASAIPGEGRSAVELLNTIGRASGIRALLVMGSNLGVSAPHATSVLARLKALEFLVVSDFFLSETAQMADVVLPSAQWAEEDGTLTNLEGRVLMRRRVVDPPEGVRTDIETLCAIGRKLGHPRQFAHASTE